MIQARDAAAGGSKSSLPPLLAFDFESSPLARRKTNRLKNQIPMCGVSCSSCFID